MARLFNDTNNQRYVVGSAVLTAAPFTISCWVYVDDLTSEQTFVAISDKDNNNNFWQLGMLSSDFPHFTAKAGSTNSSTHTTEIVANTWYHVLGIEISSSSRFVYLDGVAATEATGTRVPTISGNTQTTIGGIEISSFFNPLSGRLADVVIWDVALSVAERLILADRVRAEEVRPQSIIAGWLLDGKTTERDFSGNGNHLTAAGTGTPAVANHAPVVMPRRRTFQGFTPAPVAGGGVLLRHRGMTGGMQELKGGMAA